MKLIDTCGFSCPQPVLMVHPHLNGSEPIDALVDNDASRENVTRAAKNSGWTVTEKQEANGVTRLELRK